MVFRYNLFAIKQQGNELNDLFQTKWSLDIICLGGSVRGIVASVMFQTKWSLNIICLNRQAHSSHYIAVFQTKWSLDIICLKTRLIS